MSIFSTFKFLNLLPANEIAVEAFLAGRVGFSGIGRIVEGTLDSCESPGMAPETIEDALALDAEARACTARLLPN